MAEVLPFRGILYNEAQVHDLAAVVAPPYDVISAEEQNDLYARDSRNVIRLILGKSQNGDQGHLDVHKRASGYFSQWLEQGVLSRDATPSLYLTSVSFSVTGNRISRYGIIGMVRLEPFEKGIVLPHERTFSKVKSERLQLMKACHANFSPIFGLYSDDHGILARLQSHIQNFEADMSLKDSQGLDHKLWRLTDNELLNFVTQSMQDKRIYIADGHHRYETALSYRDWAQTGNPDFSKNHPANYVMMSLSSMADPGLIIFPAHRLLKKVSPAQSGALLKKAAEYFEIHSFPFSGSGEVALSAARAFLEAQAEKNAIGVFIKDHAAIDVLVLKEGVMNRCYADEPEPLRTLDVTVLTRLLMMDLLGFDQTRLDDESKITYRTTAESAVHAVLHGEGDLAFILNPTRIEQVQRVAEQGLIMPRKSTYFYPKVISGQVMNLLK